MKPFADDGTSGLNVVRGGRGQLVECQLLLYVGHGQRPGQVLLVGDDQQRRSLVLCKFGNLVQLGLGLLEPVYIHRVYHVDDAIGAAAVRLPERTELLLAADVPEMTADALRCTIAQLDLLRVETDRGYSVHKLIELQPVEDSGLAGRVQPQHHDVEGLEGRYVGKAVPHFFSLSSDST